MSPRGPNPYAGCTECQTPLSECLLCGAGWCAPCDGAHSCPGDKPVVVIACSDADMHAGGIGPLPIDPKARHTPTDEEHRHLVEMFRHYEALRELGWQDSMYAPTDGRPFLTIEAGSTGIHECIRDKDRDFWCYDGDLWPAHPILWRPLP